MLSQRSVEPAEACSGGSLSASHSHVSQLTSDEPQAQVQHDNVERLISGLKLNRDVWPRPAPPMPVKPGSGGARSRGRYRVALQVWRLASEYIRCLNNL